MKIIFLTLMVFSLAATADTYEVSFQRGKVEIFRNKKLVSPPVMSGDVIKVHKGGLLVLKSPQETLKIMHDTIISPRETKEGTLIDLVKGGIISLVNKKPFKVRTKTVSMGVRGTQFFVQTTGKNDVWMCVNEGVVNVVKNKKSVDVPAGKGVFVGKDEISKPTAFPWTKKINWKMDPKLGELNHKINLNYDILENFYD